MASRIQSPTSPFFLGSNDDKLESAKARAARAAKINQKNTWELNLIDHLRDIIKVEEENDVETNFQRCICIFKGTCVRLSETAVLEPLVIIVKVQTFRNASCTLEAGVKIYSLRVDSVHSEAYKVLGGIYRAGQENEPGSVVEDANLDTAQEGNSKKETEKKMSPLSTLESSFEALNVKKFDVAFAVDPLYHQTSAQFDEGGAKGLLLNNLGVYAGCRVFFDSFEVPGKEMPCSNQHDISETIDLSFAGEYLKRMRSTDQADTINNESNFYGVAFESFETDGFDHDDQPSIVDEEFNGAQPTFTSYDEDTEQFSFNNPDADDRFEKVDEYLFLSLGFPLKQNAWAGPDHWKYRKTKGYEDVSNEENTAVLTTKKARNKKQAEPDIDFTKALDNEMPDIFAPPKNPKSLLLPSNRAPCDTKLPEDCHYQPEDLVKLFLLTNVMCLGRRRRRKLSDESREHCDNYDPQPSWEEQSVFGGFDNEIDHSDVDDSDVLVS
ncbi:hypothetical protein CRYUN_Cryun20dG0114300 [Craigia yunnanensis]